MRVCFADGYFAPLPDGHRFPMGKFPALYKILLNEGLVFASDVVVPEEAAWEDLHLVHTPGYLTHLKNGTLDRPSERKMGLPWSEELVRRSRLATRGTMLASRMALEDGAAANLAGGMHHGFPGHGEGFCVLNDVAVAASRLLADGSVNRILLVDLDVHQGNGNAAIFADNPAVFTFSMHGERNFPFRKEQSDLDVELPDGMGDHAYVTCLTQHLDSVYEMSSPDLVIYLAGVDVLDGDRFGRLTMTREGLTTRDRMVLGSARVRCVPICLVLAGGYASTPDETADLHAVVHREAKGLF
jgi:acetoin utilization deacetylase AcuC-like enzyme